MEAECRGDQAAVPGRRWRRRERAGATRVPGTAAAVAAAAQLKIAEAAVVCCCCCCLLSMNEKPSLWDAEEQKFETWGVDADAR